MAKGSIEKRGENTWRLTVDLGYHADGTRNRPRKSIAIEDKALLKTTKRLQDYLDGQLSDFKREVESGQYIKPDKMTLDQFIESEWIPKYASNPDNLAPLTFKTYKRHIKNHISPALGHKQLCDIKTMHLLTFNNNLTKPGARKDGRKSTLSNGTKEYIYRVLKNILERAKDWQLINDNPITGVKKPKVEQTEFDFYDEFDAKKVIEALESEERKWRLFVLGSMIGGFRRGELIALEWSEVDFENMTLAVKKSISLTENGMAIEKGPKSKSSKRIVDMPEWFMLELSTYFREWKIEKMKVRDKWVGMDRQYVFHSGFGKPFYHTTPTTWWKRFIERHNLKPIRFHDLRHSSATLLIEAGAPMKAIQKRLGHAKHQTTADIYAHVTKKVSRDTAEQFDKFAPQNIKKESRPQFVPKQ